MKKFYSTMVVLIFIFTTINVFAHGNNLHTNDKKLNDNSPMSVLEEQSSEINYFGDLLDDLSYSNFPTLHPLIVHIPVVLIPLAFVFALVGIFLRISLFFKVSVILLSLGVLGGLISAFPLHPHTTGLSQSAMVILSKHDFFAYTTLWLGSISTFIGIIYCYSSMRLVKWIYIILLLLVTMSVSITGHYGGKLAYVHGIGVQGKYLENNSENNTHE